MFYVPDPYTDMIDWLNLIANTFWILGCALALATVSYAGWQASVEDKKIRIFSFLTEACQLA